MIDAMTEKQQLEVIVQEALQRTSEETAVSMMAAYRKGRTVCLSLSQTEHSYSYDRTVEWNVLAPGEIVLAADGIAPGGNA